MYTSKVIFKSVVGNKLIDEHPLRSSTAVSDQRHKVTMMDTTDDLNLSLKLSLSLSAVRFQALHRNLLTIWQHTFIHVPEPALP